MFLALPLHIRVWRTRMFQIQLEIRKSVSNVKLKLKGIGFQRGHRAMSVHEAR